MHSTKRTRTVTRSFLCLIWIQFGLLSTVLADDPLLVLGSPEAQRMGQVIPETTTNVLLDRFGDPGEWDEGATPWRLFLVREDRVVIQYEGNEPPTIREGTLLSNLTPRNTTEIFYRKVVGVANDHGNSLLTLFTRDVPVVQMVGTGQARVTDFMVSFLLEEDGSMGSLLAEEGNGGASVSFSRENLSFYDENGISLLLHQADFELSPQLGAAFNVEKTQVSDTTIFVGGEVYSTLEAEWTTDGEGRVEYGEAVKAFPSVFRFASFIGMAGGVPIWLTSDLSLELEMSVVAHEPLHLRTGFSETYVYSLSGNYRAHRDPLILWDRRHEEGAPERIGSVSAVLGQGRGEMVMRPVLDVQFGPWSLSSHPETRIRFVNDDRIHMEDREVAGYDIDGDIRLHAGMDIPEERDQLMLPPLVVYDILHHPWYHSTDGISTLRILRHPRHEATVVDHPVALSVYAEDPGDSLTYQWFFEGDPISGQTAPRLWLSNAQLEDEGDYHVEISNGSQTLVSETAHIKVAHAGVGRHHHPDSMMDMVFVPAGAFTYGTFPDRFPSKYSSPENDIPNNMKDHATWWHRQGIEWPKRRFVVSSFYMSRTPPTYLEEKRIHEWAMSNGYVYWEAVVGRGHPSTNGSEYVNPDSSPAGFIQEMDTVRKRLNARSEMEGFEPVYRTHTGAVLRNQDPAQYDLVTDWEANGYRLPTEMEWEWAARAGTDTDNYAGNITWDYEVVGPGMAWFDEDLYYGRIRKPDPMLFEIAWYRNNNHLFPDGYYPNRAHWAPAGTRPYGYTFVNGFAMRDFFGNLIELTNDLYADIRDVPFTVDPRVEEVVWEGYWDDTGVGWENSITKNNTVRKGSFMEESSDKMRSSYRNLDYVFDLPQTYRAVRTYFPEAQ
ncbi:MAG: SUMF1/EgtB/PvdO family nonheme iron enzyme [Opitutales bacterium]|nr:SUMF1/EgtB/PvdO family nonheme iron enzyme [Opitutales bacterium]